MNKRETRILLAIVIVLLSIAAGILGWEWYDANVDRSGWKVIGEDRYYHDFHGQPLTGWQQIEGNTYRFDQDGILYTGWQELDEGKYLFAEDGTLTTGWLETEVGLCYFGDDGILRTGFHAISGDTYYFDTAGAMQTGWTELENGTYYFGDDGILRTGWLDLDGSTYHLSDTGILSTGWQEMAEGTRYFGEDGALHTGWLELEEKTYYLGEDGILRTGWVEMGEYDYYFHPDGTMAVGPQEIDGQLRYFTPKGIHVYLVNFEHFIPEDYEMDLVHIWGVHYVDASCKEALDQMLADCLAAGNYYSINSAYRSIEEQWGILKSRTAENMTNGRTYEEAYAIARLTVAYPGTSEHQMGLAVDIDGWGALKWLHEHCWEYGFILRYPDGKSHITGIIYESWHFRYVGREVSMDMKDTGLCLEEYLGAYKGD